MAGNVKSGQAITCICVTSNAATGAAADADSAPTGTLYINGIANAASVTLTNIGPGLYRVAVTLPALNAGDILSLLVTATVGGVVGSGVVWSGVGDTKRLSDTLDSHTVSMANDSLTSTALAASAVTEIQSGLSTLTDAQVWSYATRTLTQSAASVTSVITGSNLAITIACAFSATLTGVDVSGSPKLYFTVKRESDLANTNDTDAIIQIDTASGLTRINGAAYATSAHGSITINSSTSITIALTSAATANLREEYGLYYDVKRVDTDAQVTAGRLSIINVITRSVS